MYMDNQNAADDLDEQREINQEDSWTVISAHFEEKGLVGQQLDSFNEFLTNTIHNLLTTHHQLNYIHKHNMCLARNTMKRLLTLQLNSNKHI